MNLTIVVHTDRAGCLRLSVSPFGFDPGAAASWATRPRQALAARPEQRTPRQVEALKELYLLATGCWLADLERAQAALPGHPGVLATARPTRWSRRPMPPLVTRVLPRGNWQDQSGPVVEPGRAALPAAAVRCPKQGG